MAILYRCCGRLERYGKVCDYESTTPWRARACPGCGKWYDMTTSGAESTKNKDMSAAALAQRALEHKVKRISTGFDGFDYVVGGEGLVPGSTYVISGPKGTGKTSMLMQICANIASERKKVILASGEMNAEDIGGYLARLKIDNPFFEVMTESDIEKIVDRADQVSAKLVVVDSLQKMFMSDVKGDVGSRSQGNAVAEHITFFGKKSKTAFIVISHVTKSGELAASAGVGHEVDTLLEYDPVFKIDYDGDQVDTLVRKLYVIEKNRNGPTPREAFFKMADHGVEEVTKEIEEEAEEEKKEKRRKKLRLILPGDSPTE